MASSSAKTATASASCSSFCISSAARGVRPAPQVGIRAEVEPAEGAARATGDPFRREATAATERLTWRERLEAEDAVPGIEMRGAVLAEVAGGRVDGATTARALGDQRGLAVLCSVSRSDLRRSGAGGWISHDVPESRTGERCTRGESGRASKRNFPRCIWKSSVPGTRVRPGFRAGMPGPLKPARPHEAGRPERAPPPAHRRLPARA